MDVSLHPFDRCRQHLAAVIPPGERRPVDEIKRLAAEAGFDPVIYDRCIRAFGVSSTRWRDGQRMVSLNVLLFKGIS